MVLLRHNRHLPVTVHFLEDASDHENRFNRDKKRKHRVKKSSSKEKIGTVLAALPELIRNTNEAAKDHSQCLKELMAGKSDSSDD